MPEIRHMTWTDFDAARRETDLAIIPSGAFETYGPHLPLGSDTLVAEAVARRVAEATGGLLGPTIPIGDSRALAEFPGTLAVSTNAFRGYLADVTTGLIGWGLRRLLFVNTHLQNVPIIADLMTDLARDRAVRCAQIDVWRFMQPITKDLIEDAKYAYAHAGEVGTSVLMYLHPELVKTERLGRFEPAPNPFPEVLRPRSFRAYAPDSLVGDATLGSREKGEEIVRRCVARIVEFVNSDEFQTPAQRPDRGGDRW